MTQGKGMRGRGRPPTIDPGQITDRMRAWTEVNRDVLPAPEETAEETRQRMNSPAFKARQRRALQTSERVREQVRERAGWVERLGHVIEERGWGRHSNRWIGERLAREFGLSPDTIRKSVPDATMLMRQKAGTPSGKNK